MIQVRDHDDVLSISHRHLFNHTGPRNQVAAALVYRLFERAIAELSPPGAAGPAVLPGAHRVRRPRRPRRHRIP